MPGMSRQLVDQIKKDPLVLIDRGLMTIYSPYEFLPNGKRKPAGSVLRRRFCPNFEQRVIMRIRRECKARGISTSIVSAKTRAAGISAIAAYMIAAEVSILEMGMISALSVDDAVLTDPVIPMMRWALEGLPEELRVTMHRARSPQMAYSRVPTVFGPTKGTVNLISSFKGSRAGLGSRCQFAWISEYSRIEKNDETMKAFSETIMKTPEALVIKESTCDGKRNSHYEDFILGWNAQGRCNIHESDFKFSPSAPDVAVFLPWYYSADRESDFLPGVTAEAMYKDLDELELETLNQKNGLKDFAINNAGFLGLKSKRDLFEFCMRKLYWMRGYSVKIPELGYLDRAIPPPRIDGNVARSMDERKTETPSTVEEAFSKSAVAAFPDSVLSYYVEATVSDGVCGIIDETGRFVEDVNGWITVWFGRDEGETRRKIVENKGFAPRLVYFMGVDHATGQDPNNDIMDFCAASVWTSGREQVAEIAVKEPAFKFDHKLDLLKKFLMAGREYRCPYECAEFANAGINYCQTRGEPGHPKQHPVLDRFYRSHRIGAQGMPEDLNRPGFHPNIRNLSVSAWEDFSRLVNGHHLVIRSKRLLEQIRYLVPCAYGLQAESKGKGGLGSKDDLADAAKMANFHLTYRLELCGGQIDWDFDGADSNGVITYKEIDEIGPSDPEYWERVEKREASLITPWWKR